MDVVKRMWIDFRERGVDVALAQLHPEVEFQLDDGTVFTGHEGVREFFARFGGERRFAAAPYTFEPCGDGVIVAGHRRIQTPGGSRVRVHVLLAPRSRRGDHAGGGLVRPGRGHRGPGQLMRRVFPFVCAAVLVDTMFFAAITPLLPSYQDELGLSKTAAGLLSAAYPAGTLLASLPAGWLAGRVGAKATAVIGLALIAATSVVFGHAETIGVLDGARFVQGVGGACTWAGALAWLMGVTASTAAARRSARRSARPCSGCCWGR